MKRVNSIYDNINTQKQFIKDSFQRWFYEAFRTPIQRWSLIIQLRALFSKSIKASLLHFVQKTTLKNADCHNKLQKDQVSQLIKKHSIPDGCEKVIPPTEKRLNSILFSVRVPVLSEKIYLICPKSSLILVARQIGYCFDSS